MRLTSQNFTDGGRIPALFTCEGEGVNPQLAWTDVPDGVKSFAVACLDPDAPSGEFAHWLMANIPSSVRELPENTACPSGAVEIINDAGRAGYIGPCPPTGQHRYIFTVYALDRDRIDGLTREEFVGELEKHAIASATLIGTYQCGVQRA